MKIKDRETSLQKEKKHLSQSSIKSSGGCPVKMYLHEFEGENKTSNTDAKICG